MDAILLRQFGGPEVLRIEDLPIPNPADDEALVRVHAASINPVDCKTRAGSYPLVGEDRLPIVLGRDCAGTIEFCGRDVRNLNLGDRVFGFVGQDRGTYADYVLVREDEVAGLPLDVDTTLAAAVPLAALTAWQGLVEYGNIGEGQRVLIHGGAGGVGHFAVQIAKAFGATILATASAPDREFLTGLGVDEVIDYHGERYEERIDKVALVLDLIGGEAQERSWSVLAPGGRLISTIDEPRAEQAQAHKVQAMRFLARPDGAQLAEIAQLMEAGRIRPHVARVFPISEAAAAHHFLEHEHVQGKLILEIATTPTGQGG